MKKTLTAIAIMAIVMASNLAMAQDMTRDQVREQLRLRIDQSQQLNDQEREQMRKNLRECVDLSLPTDELIAVFPGADNARGPAAQTMLRIQERVMTMAREGLPADAVLAKYREGALKGVQGPALEQACERMENNVRTARRVMERVRDVGGEPAGEPVQERRMTRELAQQMWRGMGEGDYDRVRDRVRQRLQDGSCNLEDIVAAGEMAARLREHGVDHDRAVDIPGDALQKGYRSQEMRHLQFMVVTQHQRGPLDEFVNDLEHCLGLGMGMGEMYQHMMQNGWMGPGDMSGPGGFHGGDDVGHGPGQGGHHDDDGTGGSGGNDDKGGNGHHGG